MGKLTDLTGQKFVRWKVRGLSHKGKKTYFWDCVCDCGTERAVAGRDLSRGSSKSCGCLKNELSAERLTRHGMSFHPAYCSWQQAKDRCQNPRKNGFKDYGGRGIKVCERWQEFDAFWQDMQSTWQPGLSLDRIDVDRDYEPKNCRWATPKEQANNRRTNVIVDGPKGEKFTLKQASEFYNISYETVRSRLRYGWSIEEALGLKTN